jgi:hypothetical protein
MNKCQIYCEVKGVLLSRVVLCIIKQLTRQESYMSIGSILIPRSIFGTSIAAPAAAAATATPAGATRSWSPFEMIQQLHIDCGGYLLRGDLDLLLDFLFLFLSNSLLYKSLDIAFKCMKLQCPPLVHSCISYWRQLASLKSVTGENSATTAFAIPC